MNELLRVMIYLYEPSMSEKDLHFCFCNDTATTEIYTLSLHDALPISSETSAAAHRVPVDPEAFPRGGRARRSEEHTSELQSHHDVVCRLLLAKKKDAAGGIKEALPAARFNGERWTCRRRTSRRRHVRFFFNATATTEIYTLSLHDALPISITSRNRSRSFSMSMSNGVAVVPRSL